MKCRFIIAALLLAGVQGAWAQKMILKMAGQEPVIYKVSQMEYIMFEEANPDEHEWVDLGLPSGTLWATCNVGANSPEEYGSYFAWGETAQKESYTWGNYVWMTEGESYWTYINKYTFADGQTTGCWYSGNTFIGDNKTELDPDDDAAFVLWSSNWRTPSQEQFEELINEGNTTTEWTTLNGINGCKITSLRNGESIFLPATGYYGNSSVSGVGSNGNYWANSLLNYTERAGELYIKSGRAYFTVSDRFYGQSIRPVRLEGGTTFKLVTSIVLNYSSLTLYVNDIRQLTATVKPSDAENKTVSWESSNAAVATVSSDGLVTAKAIGNCTITCSATDGSGVKAECQVNVIHILVTNIVLNYTSLSLKQNETCQLTATIEPDKAENKTVTWKSSNASVATISTSGLVTAKAIGTCTITCSSTDGSGVKAECQVTVTEAGGSIVTCPDDHHPHAIDLGLPSGTKWACCNVGTSTPEGYGGFYAWGETKTKSNYSWETYTLCKGSCFDLTKYCTSSIYGYNGFTDNKTELLPADDAATVIMGTSWSTPSIAQMKELLNNCSREKIQVNGVNVILLTGSNGAKIFLPLAGRCFDDEHDAAGSSGYYWSNSLRSNDDSSAEDLYISDTSYFSFTFDDRNYGQSVRAVRKQ